MPLFKKKKRGEIPEPPEMYPYPEAERIKKAIRPDTEAAEAAALPELPELPEMPESEEAKEGIEEPRKFTIDLKKPLKAASAIAEETTEKPIVVRETKPLFIKIDKFREILASIEIIERKISEIESVINKLKEIKSKEEQVVADWHSELQELKSKLEIINKNLSEKI
ncbi:MAG: hypothetical protein N3G19_02185 [Candidatus Pacearchaeota archaeon]|nr:hypothetical protein [Candidatus Pacearchaeota archaeon]